MKTNNLIIILGLFRWIDMTFDVEDMDFGIRRDPFHERFDIWPKFIDFTSLMGFINVWPSVSNFSSGGYSKKDICKEAFGQMKNQ